MESDADDLLLFARVMEAGSFSKAAERVHWPKSTVSRRIAGLEARLGEKLLQRSTRRLTLTELGQSVLEHARGVAAEVDGALTLALHRQQRPTGRLRVSMPADFAQRFMVRLLADFAQRYPEVQLELDLSARRVDLIAEGFDLAIRMGQLGEDSQLAARRLGSFRMGLYASPDFIARHGEPMLPEGLLDMHALMLLSRTGEAVPWQMTRGEGANAQSWSGAPATRTLANSPSVLTQLALAGVGIAAIDEFFAGEAVEAAQLQPLLADWALPASPCWAVFPERRLMPLRTRVFLDALSRSLCPGAHAHPDHQQASHP